MRFFFALFALGMLTFSMVGCKTKRVKFPAFDAACSKDTDCSADNHYFTKSSMCCRSCNPTAAAKTWIAAVEKACVGRMDPACPIAKCVAFPPVKCVKNTCQLVRKKK